MPSSRRYHESLATDDSGAASLSSQLDLYNSELASSSQPCTENTFFDDNGYPQLHNHNHNHNHDDEQQELYPYQLEQIHASLPVHVQSLPRSSPIAIRLPPGDMKKEIDESDVDDDSIHIDVEGDAVRLRRKYGNKIVQTYNQESTILQSSNTRKRDKTSVLNAPYLGSLSKSSNQVLSLPPMSLAGDPTHGESPESIVSYGSLRDSHQRGRFLDGPSSYREPMSGKIRQLDHRLRYHGRRPELNIGERLQKSRKLKELRQKEESKKMKEESSDKANNDTTDKGEKQERKADTSSLSAMMKDVSQSAHTIGTDADFQEGFSPLGPESLIPIQTGNTPSTQSHEHQISRDLSPRNMLSTSLTAFEFLKTSNTDTFSGDNTRGHSSSIALATDANQTTDIRSCIGFQPLARSMSDPSPRFQHLSLSELSLSEAPVKKVLPAAQTEGLAATLENAIVADIGQRANHSQQQPGTQNAIGYRMPNNAHFMRDENTAVNSPSLISRHTSMFNGSGLRSQYLDHDPDPDPNTDGAFGDMDM